MARQDTKTIIKINYRVSDSCYISIKISRPVSECAAQLCIWPNIEVATLYAKQPTKRQCERSNGTHELIESWFIHLSMRRLPVDVVIFFLLFALPFFILSSILFLYSARFCWLHAHQKGDSHLKTTKCHIQCTVAANYNNIHIYLELGSRLLLNSRLYILCGDTKRVWFAWSDGDIVAITGSEIVNQKAEKAESLRPSRRIWVDWGG